MVINFHKILEDGFGQLHKLTTSQFKQSIKVKFINEHGMEEIGIDQNGVFKEFLEDISKTAFSTDLNLFKTVHVHAHTGRGGDRHDGGETGGGVDVLVPSPTSFVHENHLLMMEFLGKVFGKALYEGITIDIPFASFFYAKLLGRSVFFV